eukprot:TRINITY_DN47969_c0_g1_i1.p1 TRINITY_DN47969_c0_g1~~TRINITY_DN47969_c0_g1_i1.p1  ORF type:complete len:422 (+),score=89.81 TRINITY_DN47969_c0_g1_i1:115-1380(+)
MLAVQLCFVFIGLVSAEYSAFANLHEAVISRSHLQVSASSAPGSFLGSKDGAQSKSKLQHQYPFYHSTADLSNQAKQLLSNCGGRGLLETHTKDNVTIEVIRVKSRSKKPINKVFFMFGEHSRELISPESGLALLKMLCGADDSQKDLASATLEDNDFMMVLNGNPRSRQKVESGDYCVRTNPSGVDLNRNWDEKWTQEMNMGADVNPGPKPFSEPETMIFKKVVEQYRPTTFLTVHSGTRGMYMPFAYDRKTLATRNEANMMEVLRQLDQKHCQCPFGAAGKEVGYSCPGTSIDYVYDKLKAPYSFAFEIFVDPVEDESLKQRWEEKVQSGGASLLQQGHTLQHSHFKSLFQTHSSDFVSSARQAIKRHQMEQEQDANGCFAQFNPTTEALYKKTVNNWAVAYLEMSQMIAKQMRKDSKK